MIMNTEPPHLHSRLHNKKVSFLMPLRNIKVYLAASLSRLNSPSQTLNPMILFLIKNLL